MGPDANTAQDFAVAIVDAALDAALELRGDTLPSQAGADRRKASRIGFVFRERTQHMRTAAKVFFVATAAAGCMALATMAVNCGGSSGDRPGGSGGTPSVGGSTIGGTNGGGGTTGAGGATTPTTCDNTIPPLNCAAAVVPANGTSGGVTDFTDWNNTCGKWGTIPAFYGATFSYPGTKGSTVKDTVDVTAKALHLAGTVMAGDYAGGGLSFYNCATVASFSQVQFTLSGASPGCDLELQIQTFDMRPTTQKPAGGCTTGCYAFPVVRKIAVPSATAQVITTPLASFSNWSTANANQVVALQWQFTGTQLDPDAGVGCPINVNITSVKFLP
jgi:hypothetical protein